MNIAPKIDIRRSTCPHDCPSCCALDVEVLADGTIGKVRGSKANTYTDGVICAKVARYGERIHHPDRLLHPLVRKGSKGKGEWQRASWDAALDLIAERFEAAEAQTGSESVWPYYFAGTMGQVQRDGIHRLRHAKRYSNQFDTICTNPAWTGYVMGTGRLAGPDPREMALADCVVIWGTNPVSTQVNVMTHAIKARKNRGATIVAIDIYENDTIKQADMGLVLRPGTDAALACAVMHVAFRDGHADREFLNEFSDDPAGLESHLQSRGPEWASAITGLTVEEIEAFAKLVGKTKRTFFRLGYGFTRNRNGSVSMHAATSIATVLGAWKHEGGGAFHNNGDIYGFDKSEITGSAYKDPAIRSLDQSKIGRILTGDTEALQGGPPVNALLVQNTNPVNVMPEQTLVKQGFARDDLFTVVHEQFMTETAELADVVLPATMFMEHDDIYKGGGHQHVMLGPKLIDGPGETRPNHYVFEELARRLGVAHMAGFGKTDVELIEGLLRNTGSGETYETYETLKVKGWFDVQPDFERSHYIGGFAFSDGKFRFKPDWENGPSPNKPPQPMGPQGPYARLPVFPDHVDLLEESDADHPFRLATSPARSFLNSSFQETPGSIKKEGRPEVLIHGGDAATLGVEDGALVALGNSLGEVHLHARVSRKPKRGTLIVEGLWPNKAHLNGCGINTLTSADSIAPYGGAPLHDTKVCVRKL
ncbi:molybdopterin-containing oxidoreductase family protein [Oricola cellulosilytica]|uniref:Molybdopterin oxidoreductase family protein n=1 Tax=Oricola cellulosilytica TaxID=1429082 RepID=A0A4R0PDC5_9HYPH|nr:molybdopterin-dependent oxidoreductase [Oricola cellulosilytica]TCD14329.1 molybdopterin oxidoreductase family protein [Oricola cellulosilytica]